MKDKILLAKTLISIMAFGVGASAFSANLPREPVSFFDDTIVKVDDGKKINIPPLKSVVLQPEITPVALNTEPPKPPRIVVNQRILNDVSRRYAPKENYFLNVALDVADMHVRNIKSGYETKEQLLRKKDKLSVYLSQNQEAAHYLGLYKQRMLGWNEGRLNGWVTVQQAMILETNYNFIWIKLTPVTVTPDQLKYFELRLNLQDYGMLKQWVENAPIDQELTVAEIIAIGISKQRSGQ